MTNTTHPTAHNHVVVLLLLCFLSGCCFPPRCWWESATLQIGTSQPSKDVLPTMFAKTEEERVLRFGRGDRIDNEVDDDENDACKGDDKVDEDEDEDDDASVDSMDNLKLLLLPSLHMLSQSSLSVKNGMIATSMLVKLPLLRNL